MAWGKLHTEQRGENIRRRIYYYEQHYRTLGGISQRETICERILIRKEKFMWWEGADKRTWRAQ